MQIATYNENVALCYHAAASG